MQRFLHFSSTSQTITSPSPEIRWEVGDRWCGAIGWSTRHVGLGLRFLEPLRGERPGIRGCGGCGCGD
jgi:hypothetical protein